MVEYMTAEQVAEVFQVTEPTVYRWARDGSLPARKVGRTVRFIREDVEALAESHDAPRQPVLLGGPSRAWGDEFIDALADAIAERLKSRV